MKAGVQCILETNDALIEGLSKHEKGFVSDRIALVSAWGPTTSPALDTQSANMRDIVAGKM